MDRKNEISKKLKKAEKKWDKYIKESGDIKNMILDWLANEDYVYEDSLIDKLWGLSSEEHTNEKIGVHITGDEEWAKHCFIPKG